MDAQRTRIECGLFVHFFLFFRFASQHFFSSSHKLNRKNVQIIEKGCECKCDIFQPKI